MGLAISSIYLILGIAHIRNLGFKIKDIGFGAIDIRTIASISDVPQSILQIALLANTPQIILSICYLMFNALFTSMLTAYEWDNYAQRHKPLRVTDPRG